MIYLRLRDMLARDMVVEEVDEQSDGRGPDDTLLQESDDELEQLVWVSDEVV